MAEIRHLLVMAGYDYDVAARIDESNSRQQARDIPAKVLPLRSPGNADFPVTPPLTSTDAHDLH